MKAPTRTPTPANTSNAVLRNPISSWRSLESCSLWAAPDTAPTPDGSTSLTRSRTVDSAAVPSVEAEIDANSPSELKRRMAVASSKLAMVAPRTLSLLPNPESPTISNSSEPATTTILTVSPTASLLVSAVPRSIITSPFWEGARPSRILSGVSDSAPGTPESPKVGAPPFLIGSPSLSIICANPSTLPAANSMPSTASTSSSTEAGMGTTSESKSVSPRT